MAQGSDWTVNRLLVQGSDAYNNGTVAISEVREELEQWPKSLLPGPRAVAVSPVPTQVDYARVYETKAAQREATRTAEATLTPKPRPPTATQKPPTATPTPFNTISFSDQLSAVEVEILQILIGNEVVKNAKLHSFELEDAREQGKDVVYFEVNVKNQTFDGEIRVSLHQFKLESTKGDTFSADLTRDYIHGRIHKGRSTRGGISFEIYPDTVPKLLRYDTPLTDGWGRELEAISPNLEKYFQ